MAKGNKIVVTSFPRGVQLEGTIGDASKPGTVMQIQAATPPKGGEFTYVAAAPGTDGKGVLGAVLIEDDQQGFTANTPYVPGTRGKLYCPLPGEDMNLLCGEVAGTGNSFAIGDRLIIDAEDGIMVPEAGTPQETLAVCLETVTQQAGSKLVWCKWIG